MDSDHLEDKKLLYCSHYKLAPCCTSCHMDDTFFVAYHKQYEISHCCGSLDHIKNDIDEHDEGLEMNCE